MIAGKRKNEDTHYYNDIVPARVIIAGGVVFILAAIGVIVVVGIVNNVARTILTDVKLAEIGWNVHAVDSGRSGMSPDL